MANTVSKNILSIIPEDDILKLMIQHSADSSCKVPLEKLFSSSSHLNSSQGCSTVQPLEVGIVRWDFSTLVRGGWCFFFCVAREMVMEQELPKKSERERGSFYFRIKFMTPNGQVVIVQLFHSLGNASF